jgi:hypothetical protein
MEVREVALTVGHDEDGGAAALRGWLSSAGPAAPWQLREPGPAAGMAGVAETIGLYLDSTVAALTLYDRVRQWMAMHRRRPAVTAVLILEEAGSRCTVTVTLDRPPEDRHHG